MNEFWVLEGRTGRRNWRPIETVGVFPFYMTKSQAEVRARVAQRDAEGWEYRAACYRRVHEETGERRADQRYKV